MSPLILAFDTSAAHCAAAVLSGDEVLQSAQEPMAKGQAERLLGLCQDLLAQAGVEFSALDAIGVGIGPGNFTGIRISVSAARGLALGLGIKAVGVSAFDALQFGQTGPCACAVDGRRDQVFFKTYGQPTQTAPALKDLAALPAFAGPLIGHGGDAPAFPVAQAIARITATRFATETARPAPLYLRPADAAPARDKAPAILT
ncbi:tRNA (adenosine(37)-N6)-threonylcarbamoyltransferase complex dimerization subunit type 1 TsaB [Sulfitobacter geojensis]|jgi:N6-L-threonylcarbamoyladenine synthase|uniref:tRNA (Adenosine(37)-N6)-threonylcarbamoyltransferase complex dimerization subunit type 1 TsaB n=1 Tax=Sulfitobacter geojensis TaxID=1342299 RepID=A0AAE3B5N6_9RHOB|nr:tRNA (adenosine(37)-N6)-threonylcarbamoyltransferase complex dimerization subunit type 1 TsaB [Sulfitobacter geojensis]MBM1689086.1 tRNA (adenosine(37)-N6)-threonylcarbamoyltransferase complex dimerization subunit type 1 TsaB [Sulfitobacter geojensis]MBM1693153.1 tRNA (adenosine(37)-N6)-threonylcarbamoyltransferase complex dimerization subunit type 1 TsaB [Sulfitobacter geojensis]MBM1705319.1 tRNA (adenosine(37)-N6)-threonylcarbamoyltransferase complex dimerization subunit type 1 TsaB [Sulfit